MNSPVANERASLLASIIPPFSERKPIAIQLEQLSRDLAVTNAQRAQIHADLVALTARIDKLTAQRNSARLRVKALESARSYRIAKKLRRLVPDFFQGK